MKNRTHTQKDGTIWEWEESPNVVKLIKDLHAKKTSNNKETVKWTQSN